MERDNFGQKFKALGYNLLVQPLIIPFFIMIQDQATATDILEILYILKQENPNDEIIKRGILSLDRAIRKEDLKRRSLKQFFSENKGIAKKR